MQAKKDMKKIKLTGKNVIYLRRRAVSMNNPRVE